MKKICFITTVSITLKTFVLELAKYLHQTGNYRITFICDYDEEFSKSLPDYITYIPVSMKRGISIGGVLAFYKMYHIFKKEKFDMVQYSTPNASLYASLAAKYAKIPIRLYGQWGIRYVGMTGAHKIIFKKIEKIICSLSSDIRPVSFKNRDFAIKEKLYSRECVMINGKGGTIGVNLEEYDIEKKAIYRKQIRNQFNIEDDIVFGFAGRISKDKGCNELFKAFLKINTDKNIKLLVVGSIDKSDIDEDLLEAVKKNKNIIFTGKVKNSDMVYYYSAMDIYVHPTYREGFGMVLQESAAMQVAIITTDIPGASEVMEVGKSCLLVKPKDVKELQEKMMLLLNDRELRDSLGVQARIRVEKYFDRNLMLKNQKEDYKRLLGE